MRERRVLITPKFYLIIFPDTRVIPIHFITNSDQIDSNRLLCGEDILYIGRKRNHSLACRKRRTPLPLDELGQRTRELSTETLILNGGYPAI